MISKVANECMVDGLKSIQPKLKSMKQRVLDYITANNVAGVQPSSCAQDLDELEYSIRPRFRDLRLAGLIEQVGKRKNSRGRNEVVYELKRAEV